VIVAITGRAALADDLGGRTSAQRIAAAQNNCYRDYAQTNAQQLMDLLAQIGAELDQPQPPA
jgi:hypothetical protein